MVQNPPHAVDTWQAAKVKWRQAIRLLEQIPDDVAVSADARGKLAAYQLNYNIINQRLAVEQAAADTLDQAQTLAWQAAVTVQYPPHSLKIWQRASAKWEEAIALLVSIPPTTSVSATARAKLIAYRDNYYAISQRIETEQKTLVALKRFSETATNLSTLQVKAVTGQTADPLGIGYEKYGEWVRSLKQSLAEISDQPAGKLHPAYGELKAAIADYEFALDVWQSYLGFKEANSDWLYGDDFFNQLVPLSRIDSDTLLQRYKVKVHYGAKEAKVPLKFTLWAIWEQAGQRVSTAQQKVSRLN